MKLLTSLLMGILLLVVVIGMTSAITYATQSVGGVVVVCLVMLGILWWSSYVFLDL